MLPLAIARQGQDNWYYRCSWAQWARGATEGQDHWNKRFDNGLSGLVDFRDKRGKVVIEAGQYKAYHMTIFYRVAEWVEWYCVGNRAEIEYLLSTVTHLGKKYSQGWGRVYRWQIEAAPEDWSVWKDGRLMRGVPFDDIAGYKGGFNIGTYGIRPSYWRQSNQVPLVMPE
jgi:CRISPR type IV-associated protein Csf3